MKTSLRSFSLCLASLVIGTHAQAALVAGWDFSQFSQSGANSVDGSSFSGAGKTEATFTDFLSPPADVGASVFGSIYYDGSFGSTNVAPNQFNASIAPASGNLESSKVQTAEGYPFNDSLNNLFVSGQIFTNDLSLGVQSDASIVFEADLSASSGVGSSWYVEFAAKDLNDGGSSTISWEVSVDGSSYTALSVTTTTSPVDSSYVVNDEGVLNGSAKAYFKATITGIDTQLLIDNVGIHTGGSSWAGFPVDGNGYADTNGWLGFVNVDLAPWYYAFNLDTFMYIPEEPAAGEGFWAYIIKNGSSSNTGTVWGGYGDPDADDWIDADNWIGFFNISSAPYLYVFGNADARGGIDTFIYAPEPTAGFAGMWAYVFPPVE